MAFDFDTSTPDYVDYAATKVTGQSQLTISRWVYPNSTDAYKRDFDFSNGGSSRLRMEMDNVHGWSFKAIWSSSDGAWGISKPSTGAWTHCVVTYDWGDTANDPNIWVNGSLQSESEFNGPGGTAQTTLDNLRIGANAGGAVTLGAWDGYLAEWAFWGRILTDNEILALNAGYSPANFPNNLLFYLPYVRDLNDRIGTVPTGSSGISTIVSHPRIIYPTGFNTL